MDKKRVKNVALRAITGNRAKIDMIFNHDGCMQASSEGMVI